MIEPHPIPTHKRFKNLTGKTIHYWTVLHYIGTRIVSGNWNAHWWCRCKCGKEDAVAAGHLIHGNRKSCGCLKSPKVKPDTKACKECGRILPFDAEHFAADAQHPFGLRARCRDCVNAEARVSATEYLERIRLEVLRHYSGGMFPNCECCGETGIEFLCIDHIHGGGRKHRMEPGRADNIYVRLKTDGFPEGFRVLCHNCNSCIGIYGWCAHQRPADIDYSKPYREGHRKPRQFDPSLNTSKSKTCFKCNQTFPLNENFFYPHPQMGDGFLNKCGECTRSDTQATNLAARRRRREQVLQHYGQGNPHCACCKIDIPEFLTIDHIHGGGRQHRLEIKSNDICAFLVKHNFPDGYQLLCWSCNLAKGFYKMCPHQRERINV